ncbi:MAG: hypothetical protein RLZ62_2399, partial [Bacteroidota bacterium]
MKKLNFSLNTASHFQSGKSIFQTISGFFCLLVLLTAGSVSDLSAQSAQINLSQAQRRATERNWIFNRTTRMDFGVSGNATPTITSFGAQNAVGEGFSTATDVDGNLVFYSSATQTYNRNGVATTNGAISGNSSATQGAIILPHLKNPDRYLVVYSTTDVSISPNGSLLYAEYDMKQNGGLGDLVVKNLSPSPTGATITASEAITYAPNSTGDGFWIVTFENNTTCNTGSFSCSGTSKVIKAIQVKFPTPSTVSFGTPVVSQISSSFYNGFGSVEFNQDFSKALAVSAHFLTPTGNTNPRGGRLFGLNFNAQTGAFTQQWEIDLPLLSASSYYYADFSPSENYAYVSTVFTNRLYRYDISSGVGATIVASQEMRTMDVSGAVRTGANGRVYVVHNSLNPILEIENPDNATLAGATITSKSRNGGTGSYGLSQTSFPIATDHGDGPSYYKLLASDDGPRHIIQYNTSGTALLTLGASVTSEPAGIASTNANSDTDNGVASFTTLSASTVAQMFPTYTVSVSVRNLTGQTAQLAGWIDWNLNGTFDSGERAATTVAANATTATLTWTNVTLVATNTTPATYARFRISREAMTLPTGTAASGEVEDYQLVFEAPFGCSNDAYMFQNVTTDVYRLDMTTGSSTLLLSNINGSGATKSINAVGYNVKDGYMWGYNNNTDQLAKIYTNGNVEYFTIPGLPTNIEYNSGDVNSDGVLYLARGLTNTIYRIDIDPASPTYLQQLPAITTSLLSFGDWAFNPIDNQLYTVTSITSTSPLSGGQLVRYNPTTGAATVLGTVSGAGIQTSIAGFGADYFDAAGSLYIYASETGKIFKIDNVASGNLTASLFSTGASGLSDNDGARCATAIVCAQGSTPLPVWNALTNWCPATTIDLTSVQPPAVSGYSYQWRTGNLPTSTVVTTPSAVGAGTYYLFLKQDGLECYSPASAPVVVTIPPCTDTDNDGVVNFTDVDDDNDGVLDSAESPDCFFSNTEWNTADKTASTRITSDLFAVAANSNFGKLTDNDGIAAAVQFVTATAQSQLNKALFQVEFSAPLRLDALYIRKNSATQISGGNVMLQGSNDNSTWTDLWAAPANPANATNITANGAVSLGNSNKFTVSQNAAAYKYYRIYGVAVANVLSGIATEMYFDVHNASYQASFFPKSACTNDTDGDGILNHLDTDSDVDGCSDALEAGATTNTTVGYTFPAPYGNNGLANSLETSSESGVVNYTSVYDTYATNPE